jgi:hypothetical protein
VGEVLGDPVRHRADGRQHRALGGVADRVVGGAEQRGAGDRGHELVATDVVDHLAVDAIELGEHRPHGHRHVVPRVAVGDGEDVQVVDLLTASVELGARRGDCPAEPHDAWIRHGGNVHGRPDYVSPGRQKGQRAASCWAR